MTTPEQPVQDGPEQLVEAIMQTRRPAPQMFATGTLVAVTATPTGNLVSVSGIADVNLTCQSTASFDAVYATTGDALIGARVIVLTIAGQALALTTTTNGA